MERIKESRKRYDALLRSTLNSLLAKRDRGFEPRSPGWKPGVVPLDQSRVSRRAKRRKERESNPQGSSLARFRAGCRRRSACPSLMGRFDLKHCRFLDSSTGGRSRTSNLRLNRALPCRLATPVLNEQRDESRARRIRRRIEAGPVVRPARLCRHSSTEFAATGGEKSGWPDSNRRSPAPEAGGLSQAFLHPVFKCPAGIEPALPPWQGSRLPLHHGHTPPKPNCQGDREHRVGLEPTSPHYGCGVFAARRPMRFVAGNGTRGARTLTFLVKSQVLCR